MLDADLDHGGLDTLGRLILANCQLPKTWRVQTGSGGTHVYFAWPDGVEVRNSTGKVGKGIDVRGAGGFVVLPPSPHVHGRYKWLVSPEDGPLLPAPCWLLELVTAPARPARVAGDGESARSPPANATRRSCRCSA